MTANLALNLTRTAGEHPDAIAVKLDDAAFNYGLLENASQRVAAMLKSKGIGPGDRVGIMLPNVPYFPAVYYGVLRAGAVVVPMNVLLKGREVAFYLSDSEAKLLFAWHGFTEKILALEGLSTPVKPISTAELNRPAPRPANSVLDNRALRQRLNQNRELLGTDQLSEAQNWRSSSCSLSPKAKGGAPTGWVRPVLAILNKAHPGRSKEFEIHSSVPAQGCERNIPLHSTIEWRENETRRMNGRIWKLNF